MFYKPFPTRLQIWSDFRKSIETSVNPLQDVVDFWNSAPLVSIVVDPYDQSSWLGPWEIIEENSYCSFVKILAICYTLQLTDRFSPSKFEINITRDREACEVKYLLLVDGMCIGYDEEKPIPIHLLPTTIEIEKTYTMPPLQ
jgi:hypothetical protein